MLAMGIGLTFFPRQSMAFVGRIYKFLNKFTFKTFPESFFEGGRPVFGIVMGIIMIAVALAGLFLNLKEILK